MILWLTAIIGGVITAAYLVFGIPAQVELNQKLNTIAPTYLEQGFVNPEEFSGTPRDEEAVAAYIEQHGEWTHDWMRIPVAEQKQIDRDSFNKLVSAENRVALRFAIIEDCGVKSITNRCTYYLIYRTYLGKLESIKSEHARVAQIRTDLQLDSPSN